MKIIEKLLAVGYMIVVGSFRVPVSSFVALLLILEMSFYSRSSGHELKLELNVTSLLCFRQLS